MNILKQKNQIKNLLIEKWQNRTFTKQKELNIQLLNRYNYELLGIEDESMIESHIGWFLFISILIFLVSFLVII